MFGIGAPELLVILAVALIVIGPKKLPDLARSLGRALGEFRRATDDLKQSIEQETGLDAIRKDLRGVGRDAMASLNSSPENSAPPLSSSPEAGNQASERNPAAASQQTPLSGEASLPNSENQPDGSPDETATDPDPELNSNQGPADNDQGKSTT